LVIANTQQYKIFVRRNTHDLYLWSIRKQRRRQCCSFLRESDPVLYHASDFYRKM